MKGLSSENTMLLKKDDLVRIKGVLKRVYAETGRQAELEKAEGTYKGLGDLIDAWSARSNISHLAVLCISLTRVGYGSLSGIMARALQGIVDTAIKEIDAYEDYRGRHR